MNDAIKNAKELVHKTLRTDLPESAYNYVPELETILSAFETEKPAPDCSTFRCYIASSDCKGCCLRKDCFPNEKQIQSFAEAYHEKQKALETEKLAEDASKFEKSLLELSREPDKAYIYLGYIKKEYHARKCAECKKEKEQLHEEKDKYGGYITPAHLNPL
jgi:hypothetical protein